VNIEIVDLGPGSLDATTGEPRLRAKGAALSDDEADAPDFGDAPLMQALGITSRPAPANENGAAEGVVAFGLPGVGTNGVIIGGRDVRNTKIYGNLKPGDTCLHSTGASQAAQVLCKEEKQSVAAITKDSKGKHMVFALEGKGDRAMLSAFGAAIQITRDGGIELRHGNGGIRIKDGVVNVFGRVVLGGMVPFAPVHSGFGAGPTSIPTAGVFVGL